MAREHDPETDAQTSARDGEPNGAVDDLAQRRRGRAADKTPDPPDPADDAEPGDQIEAFPAGVLEGDPKKTLRNLIRAGSSVSVSVAMTRAQVPNPGGGLFDPEVEARVLCRVLPGYVKSTPVHTEEAGNVKVKDWKLSQELRVVHVERGDEMYTREQVEQFMEAAGVTPAVIASTLGTVESQAANG